MHAPASGGTAPLGLNSQRSSESCVLITSPATVKSKTGRVRRNQPGGTKSTQPPNACRQSMFRSPSYLSSSYLTWSPSAAVPIEFVVAAAGRSTAPPSPCRGLLYTPSHAPAKTVRQKETKWHIPGSGTTHSRAEIQKAVGTRLACAMHEDWRAAIGQRSKTDGAAKSGRPMTPTEFNRRWAAVCDIIEGRCVPRPDRINSYRAES